MTDQVLSGTAIHLGVTASSREEAVRLCGEALLALGAIAPEYIDAMWERELLMSSYVGERLAIPHGTDRSRQYVKRAQLTVLRFAEAVDWAGEPVEIAVGIASAGDEHVEVLGSLAQALIDDDLRAILFTSTDVEEIAQVLTKAFGE